MPGQRLHHARHRAAPDAPVPAGRQDVKAREAEALAAERSGRERHRAGALASVEEPVTPLVTAAARERDGGLIDRAREPLGPARAVEVARVGEVAEPVLGERREIAVEPGALLGPAERDRGERSGAHERVVDGFDHAWSSIRHVPEGEREGPTSARNAQAAWRLTCAGACSAATSSSRGPNIGRTRLCTHLTVGRGASRRERLSLLPCPLRKRQPSDIYSDRRMSDL